jgi:acetate kinase
MRRGERGMKILVLNAGSSSQKSCLYEITDTMPSNPPTPLWESIADWGHHAGRVQIKTKTDQEILEEEISTTERPEIISHTLKTLYQGKTQVISRLEEIDVVGHRVVHGGDRYRNPTILNSEVKAAIAHFASFAPLHNPVDLEEIEAVEQILETVPQVAVFDTAFHSQLPLAAAIYPGPYAWFEQGIRRYGFHGTSHRYCAQRAAQLLGRNLDDLRLIVCHLGSGCSLSAIRDGHSVDTTMGFTPLDGLMMGTRSGSVDPGILIYLLRQEGYTPDQLEKLLNKESGLKGISGLSSDMRQIEAAIQSPEDNPLAQLALDIYIHRLRSSIGAMLTSLDRLDALIFTAGVGENSALTRGLVCDALGFLGLKLDQNKNENHPIDSDIAAIDSAVRVLVIHTQEDWAIAQACWSLLNSTSRS